MSLKYEPATEPQALNGGMHRDTFKDAIADIIVATRKVQPGTYKTVPARFLASIRQSRRI